VRARAWSRRTRRPSPISRAGRARLEATDWERALERWRSLATDPGAAYDETVEIDVSGLEPQVTWGTNPGMVAPVSGRVPVAGRLRPTPDEQVAVERALEYMALRPERRSATSLSTASSSAPAQLTDRGPARGRRGRRGKRVSPKVRALVVPGSAPVKRQAEEEGLDRVFRAAGFEWREAGCSMCLA
jgi:3-isopropylmalate/(R)-2-methylmalate dehydratase large subunit